MRVGASAVPPGRQEESTGMGQMCGGNSLSDVLVFMVQGVPELKEFSFFLIVLGIFFFW